MANPITNLTNIDFDGLKQSFISYLRQQDQFKDYNFEGSNMSVLLDILAYNTYQKQFYLNMALSEMFLDTAQLRDSVLSHAKELNYKPRSQRSAVGYIDLQITPTDNPSAIIVPKGTKFAARIDNSVFTFVTDQAYTLLKVNGIYKEASIPVYEGQYVSEFFVVNASNDDQRFILSNANLDTTSIDIFVYPNSSSLSGEQFVETDTIFGHTATSKVFWVQAAENGQYELVFGDGVIGKALEHQNYIVVTYRVSSGSVANKATSFSPVAAIDGYTNIGVTTVTAADGGSEAEDVDSIRFYAPRSWEAQGRAITPDDYETLIQTQFPEVAAISVFGGEQADPPQNGRVLISVDLSDADGIPDSKKTAIEDYIKTKNGSVIKPRVIDPEFMYIELISDVEYDSNKTVSTRSDLKTRVLSVISAFREATLEDFNVKFILSKLATEIDAVDASILGNKSRIRPIIYFVPAVSGVVSSSVLDFQNPLQSDYLNPDNTSTYLPAVSSSSFVYAGTNVSLEDDGDGILQLISIVGDTRTIVLANAGTVDYGTGRVTISGITIDSYTGEAIKIYGELVSPEITVSKNKILDLSLDDVTVTITPST